MKELSIEEKARRYDEAIEKAKEMIKDMTNIGGVAKVDDIQYLFPELKESDEDEKIRKWIRNGLESKYVVDNIVNNVMADKALAWLERQCEKGTNGNEREIPFSEQKPAWSEEDMEMIGNIRRIIEQYAFYNSAVDVNGELCEKEYIDADSWLKNLKDRVLPQPKQEWSEDDETVVNSIISFCDFKVNIEQHNEGVKEVSKKVLSWLNELKYRVQPQSTWKPSDEQIEALEHFVRSVGESGYASPYDNNTKLLYSLLYDLKKLK